MIKISSILYKDFIVTSSGNIVHASSSDPLDRVLLSWEGFIGPAGTRQTGPRGAANRGRREIQERNPGKGKLFSKNRS